ncbi:MAG: cobalamin-dependent protein, partial [Desulfobacteraceae bacterium]|nr:cobalamin-dependent protein [Desulfobacteraceae bacterium]
MKVLLISANTVVEPYPVYPLGLDYVAGAIADRHEVRCLDLNVQTDGAALAGAIREFDPQIIGISLRNIDNTDARRPTEYMEHYQQLCRLVRQCTAVPIVLGGSGFTIFPKETMALLEADFGIVGEGEQLAALLLALETGRSPEGLPGVMVGTTAAQLSRPWAQAVARRFDPQADHLGFYLRQGGMLNLQSKRGCPFRCIYCSYPHIEGRVMRSEPVERIAAEAIQLQEAGARYLFITDSAFNADITHSLAVARAFKQYGLTIPWGAFFAPITVPADYFEAMAACGLKHVEFGTESLTDPVLEAYGKPFRRQQVKAAHQAAVGAGLHVAHYFLFGGPGETEQTLEESLSHIDKLEKTVLFLFCGMRIYPHTTLFEIALRLGQIVATQNLMAPIFYQPPDISLSKIAEQLDAHAQG